MSTLKNQKGIDQKLPEMTSQLQHSLSNLAAFNHGALMLQGNAL